MTDLFANLKAKGITFETHVKVIWRNPKEKIIRIDKARGVDPMLERWTHIGSEPVGSDFMKAARERARPCPSIPAGAMVRRWSEGCLRLPRCVDNTAIRLMEKMPGCVKIVKTNPGTRPKRTLRISGMRFKEWMRNHPANSIA
jgi:hypothetical protein